MNEFEKKKIENDRLLKIQKETKLKKEKKSFAVIYIVLGIIFIILLLIGAYILQGNKGKKEQIFDANIMTVYQVICQEKRKKQDDAFYEYVGQNVDTYQEINATDFKIISQLINKDIGEDFYVLTEKELEILGINKISEVYLVNYDSELVFALKPFKTDTITKYTLDNILEKYQSIKKLDTSLANKPMLLEGMTPVIYNENSKKWEHTDLETDDWYNYDEKMWANIILGDVTDENSMDGSMFVWIPRYAYKISEVNYHSSKTGIIDIKFLIDNTNVTVDGIVVDEKNSDSSKDYVIHPAFLAFNNLTGIWVSKFEASTLELGDTGELHGGGNNIALTYKSVPLKYSWTNIDINMAYLVSKNIVNSSIYGLKANSADSHLMKNTEWGAVAYLAQSKYGRNANVMTSNNYYDNGVKTGYGAAKINDVKYGNDVGVITFEYNTENGVKASTTGNVYGVYDMLGGASERVSAYLNNNSSTLKEYGFSLYNEKDKNYVDVYELSTVGDTKQLNYNMLKETKYGDALYETSITGNSKSSWNNVSSEMANNLYPFFFRGGQGPITEGDKTGLFYFSSSSGGSYSIGGFRAVIVNY